MNCAGGKHAHEEAREERKQKRQKQRDAEEKEQATAEEAAEAAALWREAAAAAVPDGRRQLRTMSYDELAFENRNSKNELKVYKEAAEKQTAVLKTQVEEATRKWHEANQSENVAIQVLAQTKKAEELLRGLRETDRGLLAQLQGECNNLRHIHMIASSTGCKLLLLEDTQKMLKEESARLENVETVYANQIEMLKQYLVGNTSLGPAINELRQQSERCKMYHENFLDTHNKLVESYKTMNELEDEKNSELADLTKQLERATTQLAAAQQKIADIKKVLADHVDLSA